MEVNLKEKYKISEYVHVINKENITMACSAGYGTHLKMPAECWETIKKYLEAYTPQEICDAAHVEDKGYYIQIFTALIDKKILVSGKERIDTIDMAITHRCNLCCAHCAASAGSVSEKEFLTTEQWKTVIDKVLAVNPGLIVLTGGEPMVRTDFFEVLRYITARYTGKLELMTNGLLINSDNIDEIVESFDAISLSIDGYDEETCAAIRGKGVFAKVVNVVRQLIDHGFDQNHISLSMVETAVTCGKTDKFREGDFCLNKRGNYMITASKLPEQTETLGGGMAPFGGNSRAAACITGCLATAMMEKNIYQTGMEIAFGELCKYKINTENKERFKWKS